MNIAYLDPPYSAYFHRLAARLARRSGGEVHALLSSPAYRLYTAGDATQVWPPGEADEARPLPPHSEHAFWSQVDDAGMRRIFWHAVAWFRERFAAERIGLCLIFSDARPFSLAAAVAARELGVRCLYFERGAFRYSTASLSVMGLNGRFDLRRAATLSGIDGAEREATLERRSEEPWLRWHFVRFIVANGLACLVAPARRRLQHKRYEFGPYLRLALAQWWTEHHLARQDDARLGLDAQAPVIIVPLQLPSDSQLRLYSPFAGIQEFLDFVAETAQRVAPQARVLVKRHPMDAAHYRLPAGAQWVGGNLARFFDVHALLVCVNSNVGFEAAIRGVPVLCFGASFYTGAGAPVTLTSPEGFAEVLASKVEHRLDQAAGRALRDAVMRWYQAPGDAWAFVDEDLDRTADIVLQHHAAGEPAVQALKAVGAVRASA